VAVVEPKTEPVVIESSGQVESATVTEPKSEVVVTPKPETVPPAEENISESIGAVVEVTPTEPETTPVNFTDDSLDVNWVEDGYDVSIEIFNAKAVSLQLGDSVTTMTFNVEEGLWFGSIDFDTQVANKNGELLTVLATAQDDEIVSKPLVWIAPRVATQDLYNFQTGSDKFVKLFGFLTLHNLDDKVTAFYFYFMLALVAALLVNVLVKIRIQHASVIGHSLVVIALALLLAIV